MPPDALRAAAVLATELATEAEQLERDGVTRAVVDRMAAAGLLAVHGPPELGGLPLPQQREVAELLAGASPDAWFVWFQHGPVVRALHNSANTELAARHLPDLCSGRAQGGVAFSHLRTATPSVFADREGHGWRLTGFQPWCTGWGLTDLLLAGAVVRGTDETLLAIVPAGDRPELRSAGVLQLASMNGTSTHALRFEGLYVADEDVVLLLDREPWEAADTAMNTNVQPSTFGVALAALDLLADRAPAVAASLRARLLEVRTRAYRLLDEVPPTEQLEERLALRAQALVLQLEACTALLTARGGQGMGLADPAQRLLRAAAFQVVHSQAPHIREATLAALVA